VMDAIGFNQARGDSLNVVNAPFIVPAIVAALPDLPIWEQTWVWDIAKQVLGGLLVLFLIFGVIRPAFKDLNKIPLANNKQDPDVNSQGTPSTQQRAASGSTGDDIAKITTGSADMEEQLSNVRSLVQQDPALVAQVVKNWSASDA
jgi:flagellar M-ring protein FliF